MFLVRYVMEDIFYFLLVGNGVLKYVKKIDFLILFDFFVFISEELRL